MQRTALKVEPLTRFHVCGPVWNMMNGLIWIEFVEPINRFMVSFAILTVGCIANTTMHTTALKVEPLTRFQLEGLADIGPLTSDL